MSVGSTAYRENEVMKSDYDGEHTVYVSMNEQKIQKIKAWHKNDVINIEVDSQKPFIALLPQKCDSVKYYDQNGNEITDIEQIKE